MKQSYTDLYRCEVEYIKKYSATCLNIARDAAFERFAQNGFPTTKQEPYLYNPLPDAAAINYGLNIKRAKADLSAQDLFHCNVSGINAYNFSMINEQLTENDSVKLPDGAVLCSLSVACKRMPQLVERYLNRIVRTKSDPYVDFNAAFAQDGWLLYIPDGVQIDLPIQLIQMLYANVDLMVHTRNVAIIGKNAKARLLLCDHSFRDHHYFSHALTEFFLEDGAQFDLYTLESVQSQTVRLAQFYVHQAADTRLVTNLIGLHNGCTRNHVEIEMNGIGSETWLGGIVLDDRQQRTENYTLITHHAPHCTSHELFKYILDDEAEGAFSGRIIVEDAAQETDSYQTNRNLCLTDKTVMHVRPQLEIYADNVKCGHGATTGQLDEAALFYMRTRGIGLHEARMLLMMAFVNDVLDRIELEPLRDRLRMMIEKRLHGEQIKCIGCNIL